MARLLTRFFALVVILGGVAAGVFFWGYAQYLNPGPLDLKARVVVPRGAGVGDIAALLERNAVIADARLFRLATRLTERQGPLRAGEFEFPAGVSAREVLEILRSGDMVARRFTVIEGQTVHQVFERLALTDGLVGDLPKPPPEGSLLPETYHFSFGDERDALVGRMRASMQAVVERLWEDRAEGLPYDTPEEALVMASIIEKETARPDERARIAAVFINRLRKGMRLQSDPTVVYAVSDGTGPIDRPLTRSDLATESPYNTYRVAGLPPSPICNPGEASIAAALHPADTAELYFVADGTGGHVFSRTLKEHNRNVARWRALQRESDNE